MYGGNKESARPKLPGKVVKGPESKRPELPGKKSKTNRSPMGKKVKQFREVKEPLKRLKQDWKVKNQLEKSKTVPESGKPIGQI